MQETVAGAYRNLRQLRDESKLLSWIKTIAKHNVIAHYRSKEKGKWTQLYEEVSRADEAERKASVISNSPLQEGFRLSIISKIFGVRKYIPITARFDCGSFGFSIIFLSCRDCLCPVLQLQIFVVRLPYTTKS